MEQKNRTNIIRTWLILLRGLRSILKSRAKLILFVCICISIVYVWRHRTSYVTTQWELGLLSLILILLTMLILCFTFYMFGILMKGGFYEKRLKGIGFIDRNKETPILYSVKQDKGNPIVIYYDFYSPSVPLVDWIEHKADVESCLNLNVKEFSQGKNKRHVVIEAVSGNIRLPDVIEWNDRYIP